MGILLQLMGLMGAMEVLPRKNVRACAQMHMQPFCGADDRAAYYLIREHPSKRAQSNNIAHRKVREC